MSAEGAVRRPGPDLRVVSASGLSAISPWGISFKGSGSRSGIPERFPVFPLSRININSVVRSCAGAEDSESLQFANPVAAGTEAGGEKVTATGGEKVTQPRKGDLFFLLCSPDLVAVSFPLPVSFPLQNQGARREFPPRSLLDGLA